MENIIGSEIIYNYGNGWNGGYGLQIRDKPEVKLKDFDRITVKINSNIVEMRQCVEFGFDYDMGHRYEWKAVDFEGELQGIPIKLRNILQNSSRIKQFRNENGDVCNSLDIVIIRINKSQ